MNPEGIITTHVQRTRHFVLWSKGGYLTGIRLTIAENGFSKVVVSSVSEKSEAVKFCTRAAALTVAAAMEQHGIALDVFEAF